MKVDPLPSVHFPQKCIYCRAYGATSKHKRPAGRRFFRALAELMYGVERYRKALCQRKDIIWNARGRLVKILFRDTDKLLRKPVYCNTELFYVPTDVLIAGAVCTAAAPARTVSGDTVAPFDRSNPLACADDPAGPFMAEPYGIGMRPFIFPVEKAES